jgi:hypothetical protein
MLLGWSLSERGEEQALVDATLKYWDAVLQALGQDFSAPQSGFAGKLGGRQVVGHRGILLSEVWLWLLRLI